MRKYVIMGVQGSGKGTQAGILAADLDLVHISVGDIFRWHVQVHTKIGAMVRRIMSSGQLVDDDLVEWDYGDYEGVTTAEIRKTHPGWTIWTGDPPGGETATEVGARADRMLARIREAVQRGPVVTVGHGHFSRVLAARWLDLPVRNGALFVLGPASPCLLGQEHGGPAVHRWNVPNPAERDPG